MTYTSLLLYTLLMAVITAGMLALTYAAGTRANLPGSDVEIMLSVPGMGTLLFFIVFRPDRKPTTEDNDP